MPPFLVPAQVCAGVCAGVCVGVCEEIPVKLILLGASIARYLRTSLMCVSGGIWCESSVSWVRGSQGPEFGAELIITSSIGRSARPKLIDSI